MKKGRSEYIINKRLYLFTTTNCWMGEARCTMYMYTVQCTCIPYNVHVYRTMYMYTVQCTCIPYNVHVYRTMYMYTVQCTCTLYMHVHVHCTCMYMYMYIHVHTVDTGGCTCTCVCRVLVPGLQHESRGRSQTHWDE